MTMNIGTFDRIFRVILGLVLIAMVFIGPQSPWGWLGLIFLGTAGVKFCPLYRLFGLCTTNNRLERQPD